MITTFCTDNFYEWAVLFLKSWKATNDPNEKIHISTLNFSEQQIENLKKIYDNLIISNEMMDFTDIRERLGMTELEFEMARHGVKNGARNINKNRYIMNLFAVDKRVESIWRTINTHGDEPYYIQCDVDLLFRKPISHRLIPTWSLGVDAGLRFKPAVEKICGKINIGFMWLKNNVKTLKLVNDWWDVVNSVPNEERDIEDKDKYRWGQWTFYQAYEKNKDNLNCFTIGDGYFDAQYRDESPVWSANKRIRGSKVNTYEYLKTEYEENIRNRG